MTYGKAMAIAKAKSLESDDNFIVYFDREEGNKGYFVSQEDNFYMMADRFQTNYKLCEVLLLSLLDHRN